MKLMKQKQERKITLSFTSPDFFLKKICYEVFAKQKKDELFRLYYQRQRLESDGMFALDRNPKGFGVSI